MTDQNKPRATSASKWYFSHEKFDKDDYEGFEVVVDDNTENPMPVAGDADVISECFDWTDQTEDGLARAGLPKSDEKAYEAARLVRKHINKTDWQPSL